MPFSIAFRTPTKTERSEGFHAVGRTPPLVNIYNVVGVGLFLNYLTGAIEVASAFALLLPFAAPYAALVLVPAMVMTIADKVFILQGPVVVPAAVMILAASVAYMDTRRKRTRRGRSA